MAFPNKVISFNEQKQKRVNEFVAFDDVVDETVGLV